MERRRALGAFSMAVGIVFLIAMAFGLGQAIRGQDVTGFFLAPFLLTAALVCLGVGFHQLWGGRTPPETPGASPPPRPGNGPDPRGP